MNLPVHLVDPASTTRYVFFTGKGGVGKTSLSCATAVQLARAGKRVLLISTDPASNLDEVLETPLGPEPQPIPAVPGLHALNLNPIEAAAAYRERVIGPMRGLLPESALRAMEEQLSGSCTVEIAAFDAFSGWLGDPDAASGFDHLIFDTAPTGHTLRLMGLAKAWDQFLAENTSGNTCLGPLAGLEKQRAIYENTVHALADAGQTTLMLVSRPQSAALREAERSSSELRALGIHHQKLVLNGVFLPAAPSDSIATAMKQRGLDALAASSSFLTSLPCSTVPLRAHNVLGIAGLRSLLETSTDEKVPPEAADPEPSPELESLESLIDDLARQRGGVIMTMGKGGVGKTTIAAAIAVMLARRGHDVHLSTTDPAAHLTQTLAGQVAGLSVGNIDPVRETAAYREEVMREQGRGMDEAARELLEEDLRSPCTEEIAVFRAFAREVARGQDRFVVLDTAPTGHTLLLLDASESYQRELDRQARGRQDAAVPGLLERLRDPSFTRMLLVTLPEATPVHEAAALQNDLRRAGIEPFAWVINQSLLHCGTGDPLLRARELSERRYLAEVTCQHASRTVWLPWQTNEPVGPAALASLSESSSKHRHHHE